MSHGLPVVTTSIGAEGIELTDGTDVLIGDEPGNFAEKVMRLYADENLWNKLSGNSMRNIEKHFSYEVAKHKLKELLEGNRIKREGNHV
jgi:glycosyltransferase involved in cell wall biosynthesis